MVHILDSTLAEAEHVWTAAWSTYNLEVTIYEILDGDDGIDDDMTILA